MTRQESPRDRMIDSAAHLYAQRGVAATAMSDVLEHSGAPRGSAYHYFPGGKEQLAQEATLRAGRQAADNLSAVLATEGVLAAITAFIDQFRHGLETTDFAQSCPIAAGALAGDQAPAARDSAGEVFASWETTLATALWRHGITMSRAEDLAAYAISAVEGALLLARAQHSTRPLDRVGRELTRHMSSILTTPGTPTTTDTGAP